MKLTMYPREGSSKSLLRQLRVAGQIPAVLYGKKKTQGSVMIGIDAAEFQAILRSVEKGCLSTVKFLLVERDRELPVLLKEIQYHLTSYEILHLDFEELAPDLLVNVKVPVQCTGIVDCVGIKLGGVLRQVIRYMRVRCLPQDIPEKFQLDVRELQLRQTKRLSDIVLPQGIRPLVDLNEVAVVIAKR